MTSIRSASRAFQGAEVSILTMLEPPIVAGNMLAFRLPNPLDGMDAGLYAIDLARRHVPAK